MGIKYGHHLVRKEGRRHHRHRSRRRSRAGCEVRRCGGAAARFPARELGIGLPAAGAGKTQCGTVLRSSPRVGDSMNACFETAPKRNRHRSGRSRDPYALSHPRISQSRLCLFACTSPTRALLDFQHRRYQSRCCQFQHYRPQDCGPRDCGPRDYGPRDCGPRDCGLPRYPFGCRGCRGGLAEHAVTRKTMRTANWLLTRPKILTRLPMAHAACQWNAAHCQYHPGL